MALVYAFLLVFLLLLVQFLLTLACFVDGARHRRQNVGPYLFGMVLLPVLGTIACLVYLSRREEFPQRDVSTPELKHVTPGTGCEVETTGDEIRWNSQVRGWRNLPRRFVYAVTSCKEAGWGPVLFYSIPLLYAVVFAEPAIALASVFFVSFPWLNYLSDARTFTNTTASLNTETGTLGVSFRGGDSRLVPGYGFLSGGAEDIELREVETVELTRVGQQYTARFEYGDETNPSPPDALPVPGEQVERLQETFDRYGVSVQDKTAEGTNDRKLRKRLYAVATMLFVLPLCAAVVWLVFPG